MIGNVDTFRFTDLHFDNLIKIQVLGDLWDSIKRLVLDHERCF